MDSLGIHLIISDFFIRDSYDSLVIGQQMTLIKAQAGVKNNMRRLNKSIIQQGSNHVAYVILFALMCFFVVYLLSKFSRRWAVKRRDSDSASSCPRERRELSPCVDHILMCGAVIEFLTGIAWFSSLPVPSKIDHSGLLRVKLIIRRLFMIFRDDKKLACRSILHYNDLSRDDFFARESRP